MYFVGPHHQGGDWTPSQQYEQGGWLLSQQVMEASHLLPQGSQEASPAWRWLWVLCLTTRSLLSSSCPAPPVRSWMFSSCPNWHTRLFRAQHCGAVSPPHALWYRPRCFLPVPIDIRPFSGPGTVVLCHLPIHSGTVLVGVFLSLSTYDPFQGLELWCCVTLLLSLADLS
jgi:hypothetical protein